MAWQAPGDWGSNAIPMVAWLPNHMGYSYCGDILEFLGPGNFHCMGQQYVTLTHAGVKAEGMVCPGPVIWTPAEAWHLYKQQLAEFVSNAAQLAWRKLPELHQNTENGGWVVTSRLAVFRDGTTNG